jgi:hypothetical protein
MQNSFDNGLNESVIINLRKRVGNESSVGQTGNFKKYVQGVHKCPVKSVRAQITN